MAEEEGSGMSTARMSIRIPRDAAPTDSHVAAALAGVRERIGRGAFTLTLHEDATWSEPEFTALAERYEVEGGYHPYSRSGKLATLIAEQTGGRVTWPPNNDPPGRVY
jgi:hypothetical protein